ncbi:MAG TPA: beta-ketoacyl synthase chain length factor, partial [Rhizobacter sp.]|nr:beta-ketoacyl synthase chain length factor [Rhizobacter sp.]
WAEALAVLRGEAPYQFAPSVVPAPQRLPAAERRRAGAAVKVALSVADAACMAAGSDPATLATVFTSSSGDGANCHVLCETLAHPPGPDRLVSPTRFTNSVHNASSGAWHIAVASRASSTSLCAFDGSLGAGLIEAAVSVRASAQPVLLVASDSPYPEPLNGARPLPDHFGMALVLAPERSPQSICALSLHLTGPQTAAPSTGSESLDALHVIPAAAGLPLLRAIARGVAQQGVAIDYLSTIGLRVDVTPA